MQVDNKHRLLHGSDMLQPGLGVVQCSCWAVCQGGRCIGGLVTAWSCGDCLYEYQAGAYQSAGTDLVLVTVVLLAGAAGRQVKGWSAWKGWSQAGQVTRWLVMLRFSMHGSLHCR